MATKKSVETTEQTTNQQASFEPVIKGNNLPEVETVAELPVKRHLGVTDLPLDRTEVLGGYFKRDLVNKVNYCRHYKYKTELLKETLLVIVAKLDEALEALENKVEKPEPVTVMVETLEDLRRRQLKELEEAIKASEAKGA